MSSLKAEDAIADYSSLNEGQMQTLDQWEAFFTKVSRILWILAETAEVQYRRAGQQVGYTHPGVRKKGLDVSE